MSAALPATTEALLQVTNLQTHFGTAQGVVRAVDGLSFTINAGETVSIVGESGCGKSVTSMSILRLLPDPPAKMNGSIRFMGRELIGLPEKEMQKLRGGEVGMIFQEPMTSLNPVLSIGSQITETLRIHQHASSHEAKARAIEMLTLVGIGDPLRRLSEYPHQLSGGMRQRVMIAIALACNPKLLIADEPTTALDVTIQAQIMELLQELKTRLGSAILLITHDLGLVAEMSQRVIVMYAGRLAEEAEVGELFANPLHPYTRGLLAAAPKIGSSDQSGKRKRLAEIPGSVPSLRERLVGCPFVSRCPIGTQICREVTPAAENKRPGHRVACHHAATTGQANRLEVAS